MRMSYRYARKEPYASKTYVNPDTMSQRAGFYPRGQRCNTAYIGRPGERARDGRSWGKGDPRKPSGPTDIGITWRAAVKSVGGPLNDIVKTTTYVTEPQLRPPIRKVP